MESILEIQRSLHEERERTIAAMVVENLEKKTSHRDQVIFFNNYFTRLLRFLIN